MPSLTTTIDDPSPLISYSDSGNWFQPTAEVDSVGISMSAGHSFTVTSTAGGNMTFSFNGTGVQVFGSRREERGNYAVAVNGTAYASFNTPLNHQSQQSLFSMSDLPQALHTITLTNQPLDSSQLYLDIDFITWTSEIGVEGDQLIFTTYQDTDPSFVYNPPSVWSTQPDQLGSFSGGSGHAISGPSDGGFTYTFETFLHLTFLNPLHYTLSGDGVQLFGPIDPFGAPYTVQIDGGPLRLFSSSRAFYTPQMMLFHADSLGHGTHTLELRYLPTSDNHTFAIDYANVINLASDGPSHPFDACQDAKSPGSFNSAQKLSGGLVAAVAIPSIALLASIIAIVVVLRRNRLSLPRSRGSTLSNPPIFNFVPHKFAAPVLSPNRNTTNANNLNQMRSASTPSYTRPGATPARCIGSTEAGSSDPSPPSYQP